MICIADKLASQLEDAYIWGGVGGGTKKQTKNIVL